MAALTSNRAAACLTVIRLLLALLPPGYQSRFIGRAFDVGRRVLLEPIADNQVELLVGVDPFLFTQAGLDNAPALHGQPHRGFMRPAVS